MSIYERALFAIQCWYRAIGWQVWRRWRRPGAMGADIIAALEQQGCDCRECGHA